MANARDIKRKIVSVQNTQKVTKAMKMVSASKMRRANDAMLASRPYAAKIQEIVTNIVATVDEVNHPLLNQPESVKNIALLIINSDRGLCGAFNSNVVKTVLKFQKEHADKNLKLYIVGKNAYNFFRKRSFTINEKWVSLGGRINFNTAVSMGDRLAEDFEKGEYDELYVIYNHFHTVSSQIPVSQMLLPVSIVLDETADKQDYIYEPAPEELLNDLLPRYLNFSIYRSLLESATGEHGARMVAMDNATRSAGDMIKKLTINYNKARQTSITMELLDIVNGSEALK